MTRSTPEALNALFTDTEGRSVGGVSQPTTSTGATPAPSNLAALFTDGALENLSSEAAANHPYIETTPPEGMSSDRDEEETAEDKDREESQAVAETGDAQTPSDSDDEAEQVDESQPVEEGGEDSGEDVAYSPDDVFVIRTDDGEAEITYEEITALYNQRAELPTKLQEASNTGLTLQRQMQDQQQAFQIAMQALGDTVIGNMPTPPSEELLSTDPNKYVEDMKAYTEAKRRMDSAVGPAKEAIVNMIEAINQQQQQVVHVHLETIRAQNRLPTVEAALEHLQTTRAKLERAYSLPAEELEMLTDPRYVQVAEDALKWREASGDKVEAKEGRKVIKPVRRRDTRGRFVGQNASAQRERETIQQAQETGNVADYLIVPKNR